MKIFNRQGTHLFCGHWNDSPLEIGMTEWIHQIPESEAYHYHPYHEYYLFLEGCGEMDVDGRMIPLEAGTLLMVEPGEKHEIAAIDAEQGLRWVIIKEKSTPDSKLLV